MKEPDTATHDETLLTAHVVRHAEARRDEDRRPRVVVLRDPLPGPHDAIGQVARAWNDLTDGHRRVRSGELSRDRVQRLTVRGGAGACADASWQVQRGCGGGLPAIQEEGGRLQLGVILRLHVQEPHTVVEGEPVGGLPVVLRVPIEVVIDV